jgi:hypothetical protein
MNIASLPTDKSLDRACQAWRLRQDSAPLDRWLTRQLTPEGVPVSLDLEVWENQIDCVVSANQVHKLPRSIQARLEAWFWRLLHFTRTDGSLLFGPKGRSVARIARIQGMAESAIDPAFSRVFDNWFPQKTTKRRSTVAPPSASRSDPSKVFAALRSSWDKESEIIAVDQRVTTRPPRIELFANEQSWIRGNWIAGGDLKVGPAKTNRWQTGAYADYLEWSFKAGPTKITRTAVVLHFRGVALLAQQEEGPATSGLALPIAETTAATLDATQRYVALTSGRSKARLIPLNLPALPYATDKGTLTIDDHHARLTNGQPGRRRWLPMLATWGKPPTIWRSCTVTENMKICDPDVAFGVRVGWGLKDDGLLIYRSLTKPALRCVLGYQTRARFLIGRFTPDGNVVPLLTVD